MSDEPKRGREITPEEEAELYDYDRAHTVGGAFRNVRDAAEPLVEEVSQSLRRLLRRIFP